MARIFQDSAGTVPVTTFDQPVGKIVRGAGTVDLVQSVAGKRPTMKLFSPAGAEPRWYLYCPAGTGLEAVVDAGEYEIAILDPWGGVTYEVVTSDGSSPITFTRSTMVADIIFRSPAFIAGEKHNIEDYWAKWKITPTVDDLYMAGQRGVFLDFSDQSTLFQTDDTSTPVSAANDPIGRVLDLSGNGIDMVQTVQAARGQYKTDGAARVQLDKVDDNYEFDFTGSGGFEATWYQPSKEGLVKGKLLIPDGVWKLAREDPNYFPSNNIMGLIIVEGDVPEAMDKAIFDWWEAKGCGIDFEGTTSCSQWFRGRADVKGLALEHWDTSSVTNFGIFAYNCSSLVTLDVSNWDTSKVAVFGSFVQGCSSLVTLDVSGWDTSSVTNFGSFMLNSGSTYQFITDWGFLTRAIIATNYSNFCTDRSAPIDDILTAIEAAGVSNGIFTYSNGTAPSSTGKTAIDALRLRNWTVTVPGGY